MNASSTFYIRDKLDLLQGGVKPREWFIFNIGLGHNLHGMIVKKGVIVVRTENAKT